MGLGLPPALINAVTVPTLPVREAVCTADSDPSWLLFAEVSTYTPTTADLANTFVTIVLTTNLTGGLCGQASDTMIINFQPSPILSAGNDSIICSGSSITLNGNSNIGAIWTGGIGSFDNNSLLNATYTPDPSETSVT